MSDLTLFKMALRDLVRAKRLIIAAILVAIPALITILWRMASPEEFDSYDTYNTLSAVLVYGFLLILLSVIFGTGVISQEIEQKTIVYMLTRPVPRWRIALVKFAAAFVGIVLTVWLATILLAFAAFGVGGHEESAALRFSDVRDTSQLMQRLREPQDELSKHLQSRLQDNTLRWIAPDAWQKRREEEAKSERKLDAATTSATSPSPPLPSPPRAGRRDRIGRRVRGSRPSDDRVERLAISGINDTLRNDQGFFRAERFNGVELTPETKSLINKRPSGRELTRLNRLLIEQAWPDLIVHRAQPTFNLGKDLAILPFGALAYGAVFLFLATLLHRPLMYGLVFAFGWEAWVPNLPDKFQMVSIMTYLRTLAPHPRPSAESVDIIQFLSGSNQQTISTTVATTVLVSVIVVALGMALLLFTNREYVPREDSE